VAIGSPCGNDVMYDGERCSMVTCFVRSAIDGIRVMAVAPDPMTTTSLST
jgi:hypothetical protein